MLIVIALAGCRVPVSPCETNADCVGAFGVGWACAADGLCVAVSSPTATDTSTSTDTVETGDTSTTPPPPVLIINEVLYDPSNEPAGTDGVLPGDANGDGVYVQNQDEFVELVNISGAVADVTGYRIYDDEAWGLGSPRHIVPQTSLLPGEALVVFGGGTPTGSFGKANVQVATGGTITMNNMGDTVRVTTPSDVIVATFEIGPRSDDPDESYTRNPDVTGAFEQHGDNTKRLFSPGTRVDGTPFR